MALRRFALDTASLSAARVLQTAAAFVSLPIIARLVGPAEFGLVALAMSFVVFSIFLADCGMGQSLVRTPAADLDTWSSVFWTVIAFGAGLTMVLGALAWPIAMIFGEPRLLGLLLALSAVPMMAALLAAPLADLQQRRRFRELAVIEIVSTFIGLGAALVFAFKGAGAWAIAIQQLAIWLTKDVMFASLTRFRPRLFWSRANLGEHLNFARDNLGATLLLFFSRQMDPMVIGKVLGAAPLGNYSFATRIMMLPHQLISSPSQSTLFVRMAELRDKKGPLRDLYLIVTGGVALVVLPGVAIVAAASSAYFEFFLSREWASAAVVFTCLAPVAALQPILMPAAALLPAVGRTAIKLQLQFETAALWVVALLGSAYFGVVAVACAFTAVNLLYLPRFLQLTLPIVGCSAAQYLKVLGAPLAAAAAGVSLHLFTSRLLQPTPGAEVAISLAELGLVYAISAWLGRNRLLGQARVLRTIMRMPSFSEEAVRPHP